MGSSTIHRMPPRPLGTRSISGDLSDPRVGPGVPGTIGDLLAGRGVASLFQKTGPGDTDWTLINAFQTVAATDTVTTNSLVDVAVPNMTLTAAAPGTYLCLFNSVGHNANTTGFVFYSFYVNGVQVPQSERHLQSNNDKAAVLIQPIALATGDVITVEWHVDGNVGTLHDRNLTLVRIGA